MSKITHNYPQLSKFLAHTLLEAEQTRVGTDTEEDVWDEIRCSTLRETPPETTLFVGLYGDHHPACGEPFIDQRKHEIREHLEEDEVNLERVSFFHHTERAIKRLVPAQEAHEYTFIDHAVPLSEIATTPGHYKLFERHGGWERHTTTKVEAKAAHVKEKKVLPLLHLGNVHNLQLLVAAVKGWNSTKSFLKYLQEPDGDTPAPIKTLVIFEPEDDQLKYLPEFRSKCPEVDVVIFHRPCEKWGVIVDGDESDDPKGMFETQSTFENEPDLPWVINGISHQGESTWYGGLPKQSKTWALLCTAKSLLTQEPLFNDKRFYVPRPAERVIYLCPEASRGSLKKRFKILGLMKFLYDPITNPDGRLFVRTLSSGEKIALTNASLLQLVKGADIFIDTAVRYLDGNENDVEDVKVVTENILNLIAVGARSVWVAHHAPKGFADASTMTLENMFRGSGEFGAALTNAYGLKQEDEATNKVRFHCITGRDLDEQIPDMILQGRPHLSDTGNFKVIDADAEPFNGDRKPGPKEDSLKQQKIALAKSVDGSGQEKADAVNKEFGSKHDRRTIERWLKESEFDSDNKEQSQ